MLGTFPRMETARPFHEIVQARLNELGENPFSISSKTGISYDKIRNVIRNDSRRADPKVETAREICDALGLELYIGPPRETGTVEHVMIDGSDYAHIPLHDAMLAAGCGAENNGEHVIEHLAFRRDWLKREHINISAARLARVQGDSMMATIAPGDVVLIDTSKRELPLKSLLREETRYRLPIYAVRGGEGAQIKRVLRPSDDELMLISDNHDYLPQVVQIPNGDDSVIIGKVVWWGHTARE